MFAYKRLLLKILVSLIVVFVLMQLYMLTTVGTQGERVTELRRTQAQYKIDNDIKRAQILELQSNTAIRTTVENLQMSATNVRYIDTLGVNAVSAQR